MDVTLVSMPVWLMPLVRTVITVAVAYFIGLVLSRIVARRLERLAARTSGDWDDVLVAELKRRVPFWAFLVGLYLSLAYWALNPQALQFATRLLSALGVASLTIAAAAIAVRLVATYGPRVSPEAPVSSLAQNVVRVLVIVLGVLVIVRSFGYDITPMLTALGVGGLAVALALQEPLSSLFAGIFITLAQQVRIGDYIRLDTGAEGYVVDFNWRAARLRQLADNVIIVPNSKLAQAIVTNFSQPTAELGVGVDLVVDRSSDLARVEQAALDVANAVMRDARAGVPNAQPSVRFSGLPEGGVKLSVGMRARSFADQFQLQHEFIKRVHARFAQEGIWLK